MAHVAPSMLAPFTGTLSATLPTGEYYEVTRPVREHTNNRTWWDFYDRLCLAAQRFSVSPAVDNPVLTVDLLEAAFRGINTTFYEGSARVETRANRTFARTFGSKREFRYEPYPLRWTGQSREALAVLDAFNESIYAVPQVASNDIDSGLLDNHLAIVLRPLYDVKADFMRTYCGVEPKGEFSVDELQAIYRDSDLRPPIQTSLDDRRDSASDLSDEDTRALTDESGPRPTTEVLLQATAGKEVWQYQIDVSERTRIGEILRRMENDGPTQAPPEPFPFTTGAVASSPNAGGAPAGPANPRTV